MALLNDQRHTNKQHNQSGPAVMQSCSRRLGWGYAGREPAFRGLNTDADIPVLSLKLQQQQMKGSQESFGQKKIHVFNATKDRIKLQRGDCDDVKMCSHLLEIIYAELAQNQTLPLL